MSYEDRYRLLNWQTLKKRREFLSLVQCNEIHGTDSLRFSDFFELTKCNQTRANHDYKLYVKVAILNCYKYSFFVRIVIALEAQTYFRSSLLFRDDRKYVCASQARIVNAWNNLPKDVVNAGSLTLFRNRLRIYMNIE